MDCLARTLVWDPARDDWVSLSCWHLARHAVHLDRLTGISWEDGAGVDVTGRRELLDPADLPSGGRYESAPATLRP